MSSLKNYFDLLWAFTEKELKVRYKKAFLGFFWVFLNPILQMAIIGFVFSFFIKIPNYYLFLVLGLLCWQFFSISINKATICFVNERTLLQKAKIPKESIPLSIILSNFIHLVISLIIYSIFLWAVGKFLISGLLLIIPALLWLLILTIGISLITASLNVRFRDINFFVQSITILWFYATPVLYSLELIPPNLHSLFALNPLTSPFVLIQRAYLGFGLISNQILLINLVISILLLVLGVKIFQKKNHYFIDWL